MSAITDALKSIDIQGLISNVKNTDIGKGVDTFSQWVQDISDKVNEYEANVDRNIEEMETRVSNLETKKTDLNSKRADLSNSLVSLSQGIQSSTGIISTTVMINLNTVVLDLNDVSNDLLTTSVQLNGLKNLKENYMEKTEGVKIDARKKIVELEDKLAAVVPLIEAMNLGFESILSLNDTFKQISDATGPSGKSILDSAVSVYHPEIVDEEIYVTQDKALVDYVMDNRKGEIETMIGDGYVDAAYDDLMIS